MKAAPILAVIAAGVLAGWFAPDWSGESAAEAPAKVAATAPEPSLAVVREDGMSAGGEVVLPRAGDGHFYAEVMVEGVPSQMLVDTGATVIALTGEDAQAIGIVWEPEDVRPVARGASGPVNGVPVTLQTVQLGDFEAESVEAVIIPDGLGISLLGQSFLSRIERVEMSEREMVLGG